MAFRCALGLMSGTSMDGIDLAILRTDGEAVVERGPSGFVAYEAEFRRRIQAGLEDAKTIRLRDDRPGDLVALEREITRRHETAVSGFIAGLPREWIPELLGFHGQTVLHRPQDGLTVQLGNGAELASATRLPVVWDMRAQDMRAGGQGAPLVPAYHAALAKTLPEPWSGQWPVAFVNIGGISNISVLSPDADPIAFDTGPGNSLIDQWVAREGGVPFDAGGAIASEGGIVLAVVDRYMANPFFRRSGPKSLDRNDFSLAEAAGLDLADGARTLAHVSAASILRAIEHLPKAPALWIVCGGGRKNPHIVKDIRDGVGEGTAVVVAEDVGLEGDATEAEAWAYLAVRSLRGLPLTYPTTTGCRQPVTGGLLATP